MPSLLRSWIVPLFIAGPLWFTYAQTASEAPAPIAAAAPIPDSTVDADTARPAGFIPDYTITVTARRTARLAPGQTVLDAKSSAGRQDLPSALQSVSGVTVRSLGGFGRYAEASIRGSAPNQVQVYLDGVPLNGSTGSTVDLSKIPLSSLQRITVYKGVPPIEYFGDNAGGVINLATATDRNVEEAAVEGGSFGYRAGSALIDRTIGAMNHRFSITYGHADNDYPYVNTRGTTLGPHAADDDTTEAMDNNFFSSFSAQYANTWRIDSRHRLTSQLSSSITDQGIFYFPEADSNDGHVRNGSVALVETYEAQLDSARSLTIRASGKSDDELFQRFRPFYLYSSPVRNRIRQPYAGIEALVHDTIGRALFLSGIVAGTYNGYDFDNLYLQGGAEQPSFFRIGAKAGLEAGVRLRDNLHARLGGLCRFEFDSTNGKFDYLGFRPGGRSTSQGFPGGFSELRYSPWSGIDLVTSLCYSSRSPGFMEKFSQGANFAGNDELRPEKRLSYDAGFSVNRPAFSVAASFFTSETRDKIVFIMNAQHLFIPQNLDRVIGTGVECDLTATPTGWLSLSNSGTVMSNTIHSPVSGWEGKQEPLLPQVTDEIMVRFHTQKFYATQSARFISAYFTGPDNTDTLFHNRPELSAGFGFTPDDHFDLSLRLENYLNVQDYNFPDAPTPGRRWYAVLRCRL